MACSEHTEEKKLLERSAFFRIRRVYLVALIVLNSAGCAQLGFMSGGFFDTGPTVLASCSDKLPLGPSPTGEVFVRPANCDILDQAKSSFSAGDFILAEEKYKTSVETFTLDETRRVDLRAAWFGLAAAYDNQRRFSEADKAYTSIKSSFGEDIRYYNNYGYSLYLRGNFAEAEKQFRAALALKPNDERILFNLALVQNSTNKLVDAIEESSSSIPSFQNSSEAQPVVSPSIGQ